MNIVILVGIVITLVTGLPVLMQMVKNHPKGLMVLFFAEMWERFSYYGMRAILIFYLTQHLLFDDALAGATYGSYTSLVYLLPLIGGLLADRYLGTRKAIAFGALLLVAGHATMAVEGNQARQFLVYEGARYEVVADNGASRIQIGDQPVAFLGAEGGGIALQSPPAESPLPEVLPAGSYEMETDRNPLFVGIFYLALSLIIMGVGFLKPNISTIVGQLYPQGDPRRDSGFTLYYYGINLGAFWAAILCGYLGQTVGWWAGFGLAGVGMLAGYIVFVWGKPLLQGNGEPPDPVQLREPVLGPLNREWVIYLSAIVGVAGVWFMVQSNQVVGWALGISTIAALAFIAYFIVVKCQKIERERMMLAMVLIFGAVVFWTLFEQAGTSLNLFTDRNVDLAITSQATNFLGLPMGTPAQLAAAGIEPAGPWGWIDSTLTASQTQSFNAGFILIFAPVFAAMWAFLGSRGKDPNPTLKFGFGLLQAGLGFMVIVWAVQAGWVNDAFRVPLIALGFLYLLHTTGELFLSPVGLSQITKLSVVSVVSFMMAVWFLSSSIAQFVGGQIAGLAGTETIGGQVLDPEAALHTSVGVFEKLGWAGLACGVAFILISFFIKHWAHGADDAHPGPGPIATDRMQEDRSV